MTHATARDRLFVALDLPTVAHAQDLVEKLGGSISSYKVGLELLFAGGLEFAKGLKAAGRTVFADFKLLDIGNTVENATSNVAKLGFDYLTVHSLDAKTLDSAVRGRGSSSLKLLAVTVLTNLDQADLASQGIGAMSPLDLVIHRARLARNAGFDGIVASGREAADVRRAVGNDMLIVTPGIRPEGADAGDQARATTPAAAIAAGATHLVVGRPITQAADPSAAAERIIAEIAAAG
jgi:orotidine-5'-phosphate decarboxylase